MRTIDVFLFEGVNLLDVSGPVQAFEAAKVDRKSQYECRFVTIDGEPVKASCGLRMLADDELSAASKSHDLLIPGGGVDAVIKEGRIQSIIQARAARAGDGRLISICSGALILAASGVLDGLDATTHWSRAKDIKKYKEVCWDLDRICVEEDRIFTSAGVTTGIDLALAIIRADCGRDVALGAARELVVQLHRTGGQSQYAMHLAGQFSRDNSLAHLIEKIVSQPQLDWTLEEMAQTAGMNTRTLSRHFQRDVQQSPAQFVEHTRIEHARGLLKDNVPLKQVAQDSGFGDLQRMRRAFQRRFGVHVSDYVKAFG
ncbi:DJ-1/PfpI family protein [Planktotalea sp.]|uniref:GlxA family transcriptional regulator n=1 Tax=Planktotalea sp. TaxID=2029877 RepID=UPI003298E5ED